MMNKQVNLFKNPFTEIELAFRSQTKTVTNPEAFRTFLQNNKQAFYLCFHSTNIGKTHFRLLLEIIRKPTLLKVFLEEGYASHSFRPLLRESLMADQVESLQVIFEYPPFKSRILFRSRLDIVIESFNDYNEDFIDLLKYSGPRTTEFILNHEWMGDKLTITRFMLLTPQLRSCTIKRILRHIKYKDFLYEIDSPYEWVDTYYENDYRQFHNVHNDLIHTNHMKYEHVELAFKEERKRRLKNNWRFLFFCIILRIRCREFSEHFWSPGGTKAKELEREFYELGKN
jgi:hypothetical protein